jgi:hypothetical protein
MLTLFVALAIGVYAVWLPGALLTRLLMPHAERFTGRVVSVALGFYLMPVVFFGAAMALATVVSLPLVFGVATATNLALAALLLARARAGRASG